MTSVDIPWKPPVTSLRVVLETLSWLGRISCQDAATCNCRFLRLKSIRAVRVIIYLLNIRNCGWTGFKLTQPTGVGWSNWISTRRCPEKRSSGKGSWEVLVKGFIFLSTVFILAVSRGASFDMKYYIGIMIWFFSYQYLLWVFSLGRFFPWAFLVGAFINKRDRLLQSLVFFLFKTDSKRRTLKLTFNY